MELFFYVYISCHTFLFSERNCAFLPQDVSRVAFSLITYTENQSTRWCWPEDCRPENKSNETFSPTNYFIRLFPIYKYSFDLYNLCHSPATVGSVFKSIRHRGARGMEERLTDTTPAWRREREGGGGYCIYCCQTESTEQLSLHHHCWCHPVTCGCAE